MKKLSLLLAFLLAGPLFLVGCNNPYSGCVKGGADVANAIKAAMTTVDDIHNAGLISSAEEGHILDYLKFANDADGAFLTCSATAHSTGSVKGSFSACATGFATALNNPAELALIQVGNPKEQAQVTAIINGIIAGVNLILSSLGGQ